MIILRWSVFTTKKNNQKLIIIFKTLFVGADAITYKERNDVDDSFEATNIQFDSINKCNKALLIFIAKFILSRY
ncbi:hypothetical protein [Candidatus Mycoplasma mahonii]|uniref:hypothetical protein n=1 Tax=Candidatus Mycoplasma mahonii TaxID=3004105 RepID=UPI0026ED0446|nr:hypothetical protein [Candidatus Mycoplasma mahonii]WKX02274.1 hypothetical protein O3I44_02620 [Candidatus Mycoplasma mahonii]